jgi:hypothetical protein
VAPAHVIAGQDATIEAILTESERPGKVPIRVTFVQQGQRGAPVEGPLATIVRRGRETALDQYILTVAWASAPPHDVRRDSRIWARATGLGADDSGRAAVSRNWRFLSQDLRLVRVQRAGRLARVTLLREDGSGQPYTHPGSNENRSRYFQLPFEYWRQGVYRQLGLPGKAMLLVALSLPAGFSLPAHRAPDWYGISASTAERGLRELRRADILAVERVSKEAPLAPEGYTIFNQYTLLPPFRTGGRK